MSLGLIPPNLSITPVLKFSTLASLLLGTLYLTHSGRCSVYVYKGVSVEMATVTGCLSPAWVRRWRRPAPSRRFFSPLSINSLSVNGIRLYKGVIILRKWILKSIFCSCISSKRLVVSFTLSTTVDSFWGFYLGFCFYNVD